MNMKKINVVLCGMRFGAAFVPIYRDHPDVESVGICDTNPEVLKRVAEAHGISRMYSSLEDVLKDESVDAVHLVTPIPLHEEQAVKVLQSGRHCACTVPMAITLEGLRRITQAQRASGKNYMMMETTLYTRQFMMIQEMIEKGELGRIQFLRGCHYQDMENWPDYWLGLPPMFYGTHAIAPMVALSGSRIGRVMCFGSGTMREELHAQYGNPFPIESALFAFDNGMKGEATRSLFETARVYLEGAYVYGSKASVEWGFADNDDPIITRLEAKENRGFATPCETVKASAYYKMLPESIQKYTVSSSDFDETNPQESLSKGAAGGHHGSHPHLVHEFVRSIVEGRKPWIDEVMGANITAAGLCAHQSAMEDGKEIVVPTFD